MRLLTIFLFLTVSGFCQTNTYEVSFDNAVHHEAHISITFPDLNGKELVVQMSRTSPGRYALHEFAKNVYGVEAINSKGEKLKIERPDPYSWKITGHDGTVTLNYLLFGDRADGTYSQIDDTHAHLNIPATFMYSDKLKERPIEVTFNTSTHPQWKVATQLKHLKENTYYAPDLYYFMDSPVEISNFDLQQFEVKDQNIRFILHHPGTEKEFEEYWGQVKKIVEQQIKVYGELPVFDYGEYTFLGCYMPQASGDGMEHRNSTVLTSTRSLAEGGMKRNIGTVSHEFFHSWNVERIRPDSLEPFDFSEANMSGELWFAEGFTSYYTNLILCRAGILSPEEYINSLNGTFNYVWNSPAREFFNPIEMSYQAPFVDAATSVDPLNRENTFISYYSYGSMLGLALDLKLREEELNLDDFMKLVWETYGEPEKPYNVADIHSSLKSYAGEKFADNFFKNYIYKSEMPNYAELFQNVGVELLQPEKEAFIGATVRLNDEETIVTSNIARNTPAYEAGLNKGDKVISVNGVNISKTQTWKAELNKYNPGDTIELLVKRYGKQMTRNVQLEADPSYIIRITPKVNQEARHKRRAWLSEK